MGGIGIGLYGPQESGGGLKYKYGDSDEIVVM